MSWIRRSSLVGLVLLLTVGVSCTSNDGGLTAPTTSAADQPTSQDLGIIGDLGGSLTGTVIGPLVKATDLLACTPQPYAITSETIGPNGGKIEVGTHQLVIPKGALSADVTITAEQITGSANSVRFSPEGLQFDQPAALTMSYENCVLVLLQKKIVFTDEKLKVLEVLASLDLFRKRTVTAPIDHFSRYAVAY